MKKGLLQLYEALPASVKNTSAVKKPLTQGLKKPQTAGGVNLMAFFQKFVRCFGNDKIFPESPAAPPPAAPRISPAASPLLLPGYHRQLLPLLLPGYHQQLLPLLLLGHHRQLLPLLKTIKSYLLNKDLLRDHPSSFHRYKTNQLTGNQ